MWKIAHEGNYLSFWSYSHSILGLMEKASYGLRERDCSLPSPYPPPPPIPRASLKAGVTPSYAHLRPACSIPARNYFLPSGWILISGTCQALWEVSTYVISCTPFSKPVTRRGYCLHFSHAGNGLNESSGCNVLFYCMCSSNFNGLL